MKRNLLRPVNFETRGWQKLFLKRCVLHYFKNQWSVTES